jgi:hypothetical protein
VQTLLIVRCASSSLVPWRVADVRPLAWDRRRGASSRSYLTC